MKKNLKKLVALGLAFIMSVAVLTACGGKDSSTSIGSSSNSSEKVTLSLGIWDEKQRPFMEQIIAAYEKTHENVTIEIQLTPYKGGEYWTKLETSAIGGTAPDVFWINVLHAESYIDGDILLDLTDYIAKSDLDIKANFPSALVNAYTYDDKSYAIPKDFDTNALWYNKEIFDKAGIAYPTDDWTYDDLVATATQLKEAGLGDNVYPFACPVDFQTWYYPTVFANGGWILNEDKTETGYADPKTQEGIQCWIDMIDAGLSPSIEVLSDTSSDALFEGGNLAMVLAGSYMTPEYMANDVINTKIDLVEFPEFNGVEANVINGLGYAVYSRTKNEAAAASFVIWLGSEEAMKIQGQGGAVISSRNDSQQYFSDTNKSINLKAYTNHADVAYPLPVCKSAAELYDIESSKVKLAYSGEQSLADVSAELKVEADALLEKMNK